MMTVRRPSMRAAGFTLVELLVVMAIIVLVLSLVTPAVNSMLASNNLTQAGQVVADQISSARQLASARNRSAEVRFVKLNAAAGAGYNGVQLWMANDAGTLAASGRMIPLPGGIVMTEQAALSPLLTTPPDTTAPLAFSGQMPPPGSAAATLNYLAVRIAPSGQVQPVPTTANRPKLYLTLVNAKYSAAATAPPNYVTMQLNPDTGVAEIYRP